MTRNTAAHPLCSRSTLQRKRPVPGMSCAKSVSFELVELVAITLGHDRLDQRLELARAEAAACRAAAPSRRRTRTIGGSPTRRCRSDEPRSTIVRSIPSMRSRSAPAAATTSTCDSLAAVTGADARGADIRARGRCRRSLAASARYPPRARPRASPPRAPSPGYRTRRRPTCTRSSSRHRSRSAMRAFARRELLQQRQQLRLRERRLRDRARRALHVQLRGERRSRASARSRDARRGRRGSDRVAP